MAGLAFRSVILLIVLSLSVGPREVYSQVWTATTWTPGHATFYGGQDASGTMGGSCGYGNLYSTGYGTSTAALSVALFNNGLCCGACFELVCQTDQTTYCYAGASITITATNLCPDGSYGGWCNPPNLHFDLAYPMFQTLADPEGGVIPINFKRVSCIKTGGVDFTINGNPWFFLPLITNVAGGGDVAGVSVKGDSTGWYSLVQNWGQNWELDNQNELVGQGLSFLLLLGGGASQAFYEVAPSNWGFQQTFQSVGNFS